MKNNTLFLFALIAAIGNALFAAGQKKAAGIDNSLLFIGLSALVCVLLTSITVLFLANKNSYQLHTADFISKYGIWILVSGTGLFLTYLGFNLLYSRFGAGSYVYYAVLSIITTSLIVGFFVFKEKLNLYHLASMTCAIITIILFNVGNHANK